MKVTMTNDSVFGFIGMLEQFQVPGEKAVLANDLFELLDGPTKTYTTEAQAIVKEAKEWRDKFDNRVLDLTGKGNKKDRLSKEEALKEEKVVEFKAAYDERNKEMELLSNKEIDIEFPEELAYFVYNDVLTQVTVQGRNSVKEHAKLMNIFKSMAATEIK